MQPKIVLSPEEFLALPVNYNRRGDRFFRINVSRNTLIAFVVSVLLHAILMLVYLPKLEQENIGTIQPSPIQLTLATPKKAEVVTEPLPIVEPTIIPPAVEKPTPPKKVTTPKKVMTQKPQLKKPVFSVPKELAQPNKEEIKPPVQEAPPTIQKEAPTDMMAYIKSKRAEKIAQGDAAAINAAAIAKELGPSEDEKRMEKIKQNMKSGTNGIFEITSLSSRNATFAFKGWTGDFSNAKLQFFEVEAKSGQDIRLQLMRRMIALIREHYEGDFSWESHRLGRVITLSARMEDSAGLEDFLMSEFFGANYKTQ